MVSNVLVAVDVTVVGLVTVEVESIVLVTVVDIVEVLVVVEEIVVVVGTVLVVVVVFVTVGRPCTFANELVAAEIAIIVSIATTVRIVAKPLE